MSTAAKLSFGKFLGPEYASLNAGRNRQVELLARGEDANVGLAAASVDACVLGGVASSSSGRSSIVVAVGVCGGRRSRRGSGVT